MSDLKYRYDVEIYNTKGRTKAKLKPLAKDITGAELKELRQAIKNKGMVNNREVKIIKKTIRPNGKVSEFLHDTISFGVRDHVNSVLRKDLQHYLDIDCSYSYHCFENGCDEEGICRCVTLEAKIKEVPDVVDYMTKKVIQKTKWFKSKVNPEIMEYCLNRLFKHSNLNNPEYYDVIVRSGYYGEEIESVTFIPEGLTDEVCRIIEAESSKSAIEYILFQEYGFILPQFADFKSCKVITVPIKNLVAPTTPHLQALEKETIKEYLEMDYDLPIGIYRKTNKKYEVIDGYHRYYATYLNKPEKVKIILMKE